MVCPSSRLARAGSHCTATPATTGAMRADALFLASLFDLLGRGRVVSIDIEERTDRPTHERIESLHGSSVASEIVAQVREEAQGARSVMVVLDSDHRRKHVREELRLYGPLVTPGAYLIVEDTNLNGHPVYPDFGRRAELWQLLAHTSDFVVDREREKLLLTFNPGGYLRRGH